MDKRTCFNSIFPPYPIAAKFTTDCYHKYLEKGGSIYALPFYFLFIDILLGKGLALLNGENAMLLFDDTKALEKAIGTEAATVLARVVEKADDKWRQELATKADLQVEIAKAKHDILRWMVGGFLAQSALLIAVIAFLR
ncbi:MAG: hypothetical protein LBV76_06335 [Deltaproteobacteria bacterium]|nr:hypothetical protein [Deltaproteobacteria bacterium]